MIYFENTILMTYSIDMLKKFKDKLKNMFNFKDMGAIRCLLEIRKYERPEGVYILQIAYVDKSFERSRITNENNKDLPLSPGDDSNKMAFPTALINSDNLFPYWWSVLDLIYHTQLHL